MRSPSPFRHVEEGQRRANGLMGGLAHAQLGTHQLLMLHDDQTRRSHLAPL